MVGSLTSSLGADTFGGRRILVTGGGSGIGAALVQIISDSGGQVVYFDLTPPSDRDSRIRGLEVDVADRSAVSHGVAAAAEWMGGIDGVANVAGMVALTSLVDSEFDQLTRTLEVNLYGPLHVCRAAVPHLQEASDAAIVNVASQAASQAFPRGGLYGPSKAGLVQLSKQLAVELAPRGIRVNAVSPGSIDTPMATPRTDSNRAALEAYARRIPLQRRGLPHEVASVIAFFLAPASSYVTGQELNVGGGVDQTVLLGT